MNRLPDTSAAGAATAHPDDRPLVVAITGVAGSIGSRLAARLASRTGEVRVVGVDTQPLQSQLGAELRQGDLRTDDVVAMLQGVDVVAHLVSAFDPRRDGLESASLDIEMLRRLLAAVSEAKVSGVVLMSSAMVYGAWPNNPIPLQEDALLRPNPGFSFAAHKAEVERLAAEWQAENPDVRLVVLRPVTAVAAGESSWVARTLRAAVTVAAGDDNPPVQFLHLDDLAAAVELAVLGDLSGAYNVAPDGYVSAARTRRLSGMVPWLRVPPQVASWLARFRWRWRLAPTPPGVVPLHPVPLGRVERAPAVRRLGAPAQQRGVLRRCAPCQALGHHDVLGDAAEVPGGARRSRGDRIGNRHRSDDPGAPRRAATAVLNRPRR